MTYGAEGCTETIETKQMIQMIEMNILKSILCKTQMDRI